MATENPPSSKSELHYSFRVFLRNVRLWFRDFLNLYEGLDREGTIESITSNRKMRGANAWLLMCSIMVASLGLDLNSPAVIIGAMLISPLMSPILGIGLGVGVNDRKMITDSLQHFGIAMLIALATSFIYFKLTPFGDLTSEIANRTKPTTLDVLVAFFGGIAGIISGSRKDKSNAIPGVAIATALMPPLCVTGFGLANQEWEIMISSFYLFFLNAVFIALSTYLIVRLLRFPSKSFETERDRRRAQWFIAFFILLLLIPSAFLLRQVLEDLQYNRRINMYVNTYFSEKDLRCLDWSFERDDSTNYLALELISGRIMTEDSTQLYEKRLEEFGIFNTELYFFQSSNLNVQEMTHLRSKVEDINEFSTQLQRIEDARRVQEKAIQQLSSRLDSLSSDTVTLKQVASLAKIFMPDLQSLSFERMPVTDFKTGVQTIPVAIVEWEGRKSGATRQQDEQKLYEFIKYYNKLDTLRIVSGH